MWSEFKALAASLLVAFSCLVLFPACETSPSDSAAETSVFDPSSGSWTLRDEAGAPAGSELRRGTALYLRTESGEAYVGSPTATELAHADQQWTGDALVPGATSWVRVLDGEAHHLPLSEVPPGARIAWKGRVFETRGDATSGVTAVRGTGEVIQRVLRTSHRSADEVVDAALEYADGSTGTLTATPDHPFWVPDLGQWRTLGSLEPGRRLQTRSGRQAVLVSKAWRQGSFDVFNFEVDRRHNYFVAGEPGGSAALVHNGCGGAKGVASKAVDAGGDAAGSGKRFSDEKAALVDMAKGDKRQGMTSGDMEAYKELNAELPDPFPSNKVRGPESHPNRPHGKEPHGHVGPVDHIPIKDEP